MYVYVYTPLLLEAVARRSSIKKLLWKILRNFTERLLRHFPFSSEEFGKKIYLNACRVSEHMYMQVCKCSALLGFFYVLTYLYLSSVIYEVLIHFWPMFQFYTRWKHQKTKGFLVFSGGIKWEHWPEVS